MQPVTAYDRDMAIRTLLGEARGESPDGQRAVAWVIRNRADIARLFMGRTGRPHRLFGDGSLAGVVRAPLQFSCWNGNDPNAAIIAAWDPGRRPYGALGEILDQVVAAPAAADPTQGATHYFTAAAPRGAATWPPKWAAAMAPRGRIGAHLFYREG